MVKNGAYRLLFTMSHKTTPKKCVVLGYLESICSDTVTVFNLIDMINYANCITSASSFFSSSIDKDGM